LLGGGRRIPCGRGTGPLAPETIVAGAVDTLPRSPADPAWDALPAATASVYPQRTVRLNDRDANAALDEAEPVTLEIRAATTARDLAIRASWPDATENRSEPPSTGPLARRGLRGSAPDGGSDAAPHARTWGDPQSASFRDAAAIQIPERFGAGRRLPYVGMGDVASPVRVYMQRAAAGAAPVNEYVAAGFGSLTRAAQRHASGELVYDASAGTWRAVFRRPLRTGGHDVARGLVPVAFALWDGARHERGGNKRLSGWKLLRSPRFPVAAAYARELALANSSDRPASAARGKQLAEATCTACHRIGRSQSAPAGLAPDLSGIGAIATFGYLRQSLRDPGAVVLRGSRFGAMPSFAGLPAQDVSDIVAYLKALEGKEE
jgi:complex iron-sulfur molybdoenzyme family reductase subunit gamma